MFAVADGKQSGKYQNHPDAIFPTPKHTYEIDVPMNENKSPARSVRGVITKLVYESLEEELAANPGIMNTLAKDPHDRTTRVLDTPAYTEHPCVLKAAAEGSPLPLPLALFIDGVGYQQQAAGRSDSITGLWIVNWITGKRHLVCTLKTNRRMQLWLQIMVQFVPAHVGYSMAATGHAKWQASVDET